MKKKWIWIILAVVLCAAIAIGIVLWNLASQPQNSSDPASSPQTTITPNETPKPLVTPSPGDEGQTTSFPTPDPETVDPRDAKPAGGTDPDAGNANARQAVVLDMAKRTYHRATCPTLADRSNTTTKMEAVGKGYQACGICKP